MLNPIERNAFALLKIMVDSTRDQYPNDFLQQQTGLSPRDIDDAISYLEDLGAIQAIKALGTAPYHFLTVFFMPRGSYLYHEIKKKLEEENNRKEMIALPTRPFYPIGSPYGFNEDDYNTVAFRKRDITNLYIVVGYQFSSEFYNTTLLLDNIKNYFEKVLKELNEKRDGKIGLLYEPLSAGLGEHLFNKIARDIIGADIAIFETSNLNPNVMLEMGVALTWGTRVVPFKRVDCPKPPSDVSGQTYVDYEDSATKIVDPQFEKKLLVIIERVIGTKKP
jgi:hypothetical protein